METSAKKRILVVDDDLISLKIVCEMLTKLGYETTAANSGREALELIMNEDIFHLVVTDINMPELDGWSLARNIRVIYPHISIVALTGEHPNSIYPRLDASGIAYALFKPLKFNQLQEAITRILHNEEEKIAHRQVASQ